MENQKPDEWAGADNSIVPRRKVIIALQGGGTHGAVQWGFLQVILDRLEKSGAELVGVVGTSAGAMNAVYAASGWGAGREGSRAASAIAKVGHLWTEVDRLMPKLPQDAAADMFSYLLERHLFNPYGWLVPTVAASLTDMFQYMSHRHPGVIASEHLGNHLQGKNPLQTMLERDINFEKLTAPNAVKVFVNTVDAATGRSVIYTAKGLSARAVAGSGTLPEIFGRGVQIDNIHNFDGGFARNPPLKPAYDLCPEATDIIVLRVSPRDHPAGRGHWDKDAAMNRREQIRWNAALDAELEYLPDLAKAQGRTLHIHDIAPPADWKYDQRSKVDLLNVRRSFFEELRVKGEEIAHRWWMSNGSKIGRESSYDSSYVLVSTPERGALPVNSPGPKAA